ncbi:Uncharacterised protein [Candidatus Tiddalikarchaeum anstoanum]|nr:Uncharacterised protein [Candidatus Tiddalikarchaeum anstoanum]
MKKAQFVSPIIILAIIIVSTYIILNQRIINEAATDTIIGINPIINNLENITVQDLNFQNNITKRIIQLASTTNSSETITSIIRQEYGSSLTFSNEIIINYARTYYIGNNSKLINNTIIVPYPYNQFLREESRLLNSLAAFGTCIGTDCTNFNTCVNNYDSLPTDWVPVSCEIGPPIMVRIELINQEYPLTYNYTYHTFNNNPIKIG